MSAALVERFGIEDAELVAFVGGGGKSTLTLRLAQELIAEGRRIVVTTTTKMGVDQVPSWATVAHRADQAANAIDRGEHVFLAESIAPPKVLGVPPGMADAVFAANHVTVLVEADGARRRPFKAPGPNEPVIPTAATLVVSVVGIDAVGGLISNVCHRPERVAALTGRRLGDTLRPEDVATVLAHAEGGGKGVPPSARRMVAVTKVGPGHEASVAAIRTMLQGLPVVAIARTEY
jgi:probable selenium-dependent hydroxylase accessory protein YqeC